MLLCILMHKCKSIILFKKRFLFQPYLQFKNSTNCINTLWYIVLIF
uniref:Uncharacterized protein n=1 Tax=Anguilla anguilla TaxID=7936 RepID=A0A0E9SZK7_ANGAN